MSQPTIQHLQLEIKSDSITDAGTFEGWASVYGNVDQQRDIIAPGAFKADSGKQVPVLFAHKTDAPVGIGVLTDTSEGVKISGQLDLDTEDGRNALSRLKKGIVRNLSVGFEIVEKSFAGAIRTITAGVIREVSLVVFGANSRAVVTAVKEEQEQCAAKELIRYL